MRESTSRPAWIPAFAGMTATVYIGAKLQGFRNVISVTAKPLRKAAACAPVYEEFH